MTTSDIIIVAVMIMSYHISELLIRSLFNKNKD